MKQENLENMENTGPHQTYPRSVPRGRAENLGTIVGALHPQNFQAHKMVQFWTTLDFDR